MKRLLGFLGFFAGIALLCAPRFVHAEVIRDFRVEAEVDAERNLTVVETITYDFEKAEKHGIFRKIPVRYDRNGYSYHLRLGDIETRMDDAPIETDISNTGGSVVIKIGDPDRTITGSHVYTIRYRTNRAINFFDDHSELYWNVTGNEWPVIIEQSSFSLKMPPEILKYPPKAACYTGPYGSPAAECKTNSFDRFVTFSSSRALLPGEGFTIVAGMPRGIIRAPSSLERALMILRDNFALAIPVIVFVFMFSAWWKFGRDPQMGSVIPEYEPPEHLEPHEVAAARENGTVPARGVAAALIELARRGYIHVRFGEKDGLFSKTPTYTLVKMKEPKDLDAALAGLMSGMFDSGPEIRVDQFREKKIYLVVTAFRKRVADAFEKRGYFSNTWYNNVGVYVIVGVLLIWLSVLFGGGTIFGVFAVVVSGLIIIAFGFIMPKRTLKGTEILRKIKGFELYLTVAEKDRIAFHNAPARTPERFQALLPYAIALGVEKEWTEQFKDMDIQAPDWAEGDAFRANWMTSLVRNIGAFNASAAAGFSPSSAGSGGSGFSGGGSGGGFGGGGGGSW